MAKDAGWGRRLRLARAAFEERQDHKRLSYREIGERVGHALGREPFEYTTVRAWFVDGQEPESFAVAKALARALKADPAALIIGADEEEVSLSRSRVHEEDVSEPVLQKNEARLAAERAQSGNRSKRAKPPKEA